MRASVVGWALRAATTSALLAGCVSVDERLQANSPNSEAISEDMSDPNWKVRCLAAYACGSTPHGRCFDRLPVLLTDDPEERVQACALEALAARCDTGGREIIARVTWQTGDSPGPVVARAFADAASACPSADATLSLALTRNGTFHKALLLLVGDENDLLSADVRERAKYLESVARLPAPRSRTQAALTDARAELDEDEDADGRATVAARQSAVARGRDSGASPANSAVSPTEKTEPSRETAAEIDAQSARNDQANQRTNEATAYLEKAIAALRERNSAVYTYLIEAESRGADVTQLRPQVEKMKLEVAAEHLVRAWQLVRKDKPLEAEEERRQAEALGGMSPGLEEAIASTPTALRLRADEEKADRRRKAQEERAIIKAERQRLVDEQRRAVMEQRKALAAERLRSAEEKRAFAKEEQAKEEWRERVRKLTERKPVEKDPKCGIIAGTIVQKLGPDRYELSFFNGSLYLPLIMITEEPIGGVGEATFWCAHKVGTERVQLKNGFTAEWEVWRNDPTRRWSVPE